MNEKKAELNYIFNLKTMLDAIAKLELNSLL